MTPEPAKNNQIIPGQFVGAPDLEPVSWNAIRVQLGIAGEQLPAQTLVDETFTIVRARQFPSAYKEGDHAYFCVIKRTNSADPYSVVLGGGAVVEVLDTYIQSGLEAPLKVTLRYKSGGRHDGYYFFE